MVLSLSGLGRSAESCVLLNPPASSGLTSFHLTRATVDFASFNQTVTCVLMGRLDLLSLERRNVWNECKHYEIYLINSVFLFW